MKADIIIFILTMTVAFVSIGCTGGRLHAEKRNQLPHLDLKKIDSVPAPQKTPNQSAEVIVSDINDGHLKIPPDIFALVEYSLNKAEQENKADWVTSPPISSQSVDTVIKYNNENIVMSQGGVLIGMGGKWKRITNSATQAIYHKANEFSAARRANPYLTGDDFLRFNPWTPLKQ